MLSKAGPTACHLFAFGEFLSMRGVLNTGSGTTRCIDRLTRGLSYTKPLALLSTHFHVWLPGMGHTLLLIVHGAAAVARHLHFHIHFSYWEIR